MRYIGSNWPKYRNVWVDMQDNPSAVKRSFCFAAFFWGPFWLLYRKQYAPAFAIFAASMAMGYIAPDLRRFLALAVASLLGSYGKSYIVSSGMRTIRNVKSLGLSTIESCGHIERAGGTSWAAALSPLIVLTAIGMIAAKGLKSKTAETSGAPAAAIYRTF